MNRMVWEELMQVLEDKMARHEIHRSLLPDVSVSILIV
jgi:hypothetical protein